MLRVALVSMPFAAIDYPSLALGLFKSRLRAERIPCDVHYLNMTFMEMIGYAGYTALVTQPPAYFAAEQVFAESAFGSAVPPDDAYYDAAGLGAAQRQQLQAVKACVEPFLAHCLQAIDWNGYDIIGFTSLFEQNLATLALARRLKAAFPSKILVFGGPNFEAIMGETYHRLLPFMDIVCSGEADDTFPELIKRLAYRHPIHDLKGIVHRHNGLSVRTGAAAMTSRLDALPVPDFSEYFERFRRLALPAGVEASVLLETSRGCWWGEKNHCTFCGLNSQAMTYRTKSAGRAVAEIAELKHLHHTRFVRVVDNILNHEFFDDFLPELASRKLGVTVFFEVKANLRKHQIATLARAGVTIVQAGIESLSTHTLKLMKKGSTALMNIQTLKWCREYGVLCDWNLIYGFPGEVAADYRDSLERVRVLTHLSPPTGCSGIRLDRFSPNFDRSAEMGLTKVRALSWYRFLYPFGPRELDDIAYYFDFDYATPIDDGGYRGPLHAAVAAWQAGRDRDVLRALPDGDGLLIEDTRPVAAAARTRLDPFDRAVLESCDQIASARRVQQMVARSFPDASLEQVGAALGRLAGRHLLLEEEGRFLALPVLTYTPAPAVERRVLETA